MPFDGSARSIAALARARLSAMALGGGPPDLRQEALREGPLDVIAVAVVPESERYAREKGWLEADEDFDVHVVRRPLPPEVRQQLRSEFSLVD